MINWDSVRRVRFRNIEPVLEAVAQARSVGKLTLFPGDRDPHGQSLLSVLGLHDDRARSGSKATAPKSTVQDCRPVLEKALRGPLKEIYITANDEVLRTCVQAIDAAGKECRIAKLKLRRIQHEEACNIDLGMLFESKRTFHISSWSPSIVDALWRSRLFKGRSRQHLDRPARDFWRFPAGDCRSTSRRCRSTPAKQPKIDYATKPCGGCSVGSTYFMTQEMACAAMSTAMRPAEGVELPDSERHRNLASTSRR